jgi:hypothetical protein
VSDAQTGADDDDHDAGPTGTDVVEDAFLACREAGLRLPPVPRELVDSMQELFDGAYGSRPVDPFDREAFLSAARDRSTKPLVAFGNVGHGISSWWFCYQVIAGALGLFVRIPFGGIGSSDEAARGAVNHVLALAEELIVAADEAAEKGALRGGRAIVVADALEESFLLLGEGAQRIETEDPMGDALGQLRAA